MPRRKRQEPEPEVRSEVDMVQSRLNTLKSPYRLTAVQTSGGVDVIIYDGPWRIGQRQATEFFEQMDRDRR